MHSRRHKTKAQNSYINNNKKWLHVIDNLGQITQFTVRLSSVTVSNGDGYVAITHQ